MIVTNESQKQELVNSLLVDQMKLEARLAPKFKKLIRQIGSEGATYYINNKRVINADNYTSETITLLREHYRIVIPKFGFQIRKQVGLTSKYFNCLDDMVETKQINNEFDEASIIYINNHSEEQAELITETNQKDLDKATNSALISLLLLMGVSDEQLTPFLNQELAVQRVGLQALVDSNTEFTDKFKEEQFERFFKREMNNKASNRSVAIAITETNDPMNFAMTTEAQLASQDNDIAEAAVATGLISASSLQFGLLPISKEWVAVLDSRTRATHAAADGQVVAFNGTFKVGGYDLRYPGDSTLGAPAQEVVNCRCKALAIFE